MQVFLTEASKHWTPNSEFDLRLAAERGIISQEQGGLTSFDTTGSFEPGSGRRYRLWKALIDHASVSSKRNRGLSLNAGTIVK